MQAAVRTWLRRTPPLALSVTRICQQLMHTLGLQSNRMYEHATLAPKVACSLTVTVAFGQVGAQYNGSYLQ